MSKLNSWSGFSLDEPLTALVIAKSISHWHDASHWYDHVSTTRCKAGHILRLRGQGEDEQMIYD